MTNKYILGAGISALCYAYYHPEYIIIGDELGGRLNKKFFENIIYFHATLETQKLLDDLHIKYIKKTQNIVYVINKQCIKNITVIDKINFIKKKLNDENFMPNDLTLSTNDYYISIFEFSYKELLDALSKNVSFIQDKVIRITDKEIITEKTRYEYDNIVSTLPADIFWQIYYKQSQLEFKKKTVTFVLCDKEPDFAKNINYDLLYIVDTALKYNRISKKFNTEKDFTILYEFTGNISKEEISKYLPENTKILEYYIDSSGIIYTNKNNFSPKNVLFIGRFATWNHADKLQDVLQAALWEHDIRHIWNRQGNFSTKVGIDFNNSNTIEDKEKITHILILHLLSEVSEVLNETNFKLHKNKKRIDIEKMHEELIDCFKYLLNLFLIWNINSKKFVEIFSRKSDTNDKRLEKEGIL
jgi:hypothetical protein